METDRVLKASLEFNIEPLSDDNYEFRAALNGKKLALAVSELIRWHRRELKDSTGVHSDDELKMLGAMNDKMYELEIYKILTDIEEG